MPGQNKATARALDILSLFAAENPSYNVATLSRQLGLTKNAVFRSLETLVHRGYLVRDATKTRYELGPGVVQLRSPRWENPEFRALCRPHMEQLADLTGQSIHLLVHAGDFAIVVESIEGLQDRFRLAIGTTLPLHVSPGARCILAALGAEELERYIKRRFPLEGFTSGTLTDPDQLRRNLADVRSRGFAVSHEDFIIGRVGVAFPVMAHDSKPHGSIVIAGSRANVTEEKIMAMMPSVQPLLAELNRFSRLYRARTPTISGSAR